MPPLEHSTAEAAAAPPGPGPDAIRRAMRGPAGRAALIMPAPPEPGRRRVALALLEDAGRGRGGTVLQAADGTLLLTDSLGPDADRAAAAIERLFGQKPERLDPAADIARLLALPAPAPASQPPSQPAASGIERLADEAPLPSLLRRDGIMMLAPGRKRRLALLRLRLPRHALAASLGPSGADPDLLRHARDRLRARILAALADPAQRDALLGGAPPVPLLLDLPARMLPDAPAVSDDEPAAAPALIAALTAGEAMVDDLPARHAALRRLGWGLAVRGLDAAALSLLAPEALPADILLLRWSPALAGRTATAALRRVDPERVVLTGVDGEQALEWALALGIGRFTGPWIATLQAATRMAACPHAAACTRVQCAARGAAATPEGRAGCAAPALLAALLPPEAAS
ncbi:hypothetical protein J5Y09_09390 [Roseomonas sp. PWR1]|uniref:EAL domain-containing protein n=1 Tax=Roseomonas nitratireducens TaxID=2820810 RepID=A0ABS4ARZ8_9PROT|nr:hypothetical protein [Neoroseomonas nitratireducens]MBP0464123.1 hypothetical protein [Neoroseomonas nitratireducens]